MAEVWAVVVRGRGRWPFDASELIVFTVDVTTMGHSTNESTNSARSHHFLLNNQEYATVLSLAHQLSVFCKMD